MNGVARLLAIVGGGVLVIAFCYAGILWMTASGDPGKMGQARTALMGAIGGLVIVGVAFVVPRVISTAVIVPAGGVPLESDAGENCDDIMRRQFVFQRAASTDDKFNTIIAQIQAQRFDCSSDSWNPSVDDAAGVPGAASCFADVATATGSSATVGDQLVPRGLRDGNDETGEVRQTSGRDADNNIVVYWG